MTRVTIDRPTGVLRVGGEKLFPLGLSNGPPLGGKTPDGKDALAEIAGAGASFIRTGRGDWAATLTASNVRAAARSIGFSIMFTSTFGKLTPRSNRPAARSPGSAPTCASRS